MTDAAPRATDSSPAQTLARGLRILDLLAEAGQLAHDRPGLRAARSAPLGRLPADPHPRRRRARRPRTGRRPRARAAHRHPRAQCRRRPAVGGAARAPRPRRRARHDRVPRRARPHRVRHARHRRTASRRRLDRAAPRHAVTRCWSVLPGSPSSRCSRRRIARRWDSTCPSRRSSPRPAATASPARTAR